MLEKKNFYKKASFIYNLLRGKILRLKFFLAKNSLVKINLLLVDYF
jgi:hypothetical protein